MAPFSARLSSLGFLIVAGLTSVANAANTTSSNGVLAYFYADQIVLTVTSPYASDAQAPSAGLYCPGQTPIGYAPTSRTTSTLTYTVPSTYVGLNCAIQVVSGTNYDTHQFQMPTSVTDSSTDIYSNVPGYDIIMIGGQSNASNSGIGPAVDPLAGLVDSQILQATCDDTNNDNLLDNGETSELVSAFDYVHDCFGGAGAQQQYVVQTGRLGFGVSFARQYALRNLTPGRKVLIVAGAVPGSGSPAWISGATPYLPNLLSRVQTALALPGTNRVVAFLWSQGEAEIGAVGDALNAGTYNQTQYDQYVDDYAQRIITVVNLARTTLNLPKLPFMISQHAPHWIAYQDIKLHFQDVDAWIASYVGYSAQVPSTGELSNPLCTGALVGTNNCEDAAMIHFSAQSHIDMGGRFFQTLQIMQQEEP